MQPNQLILKELRVRECLEEKHARASPPVLERSCHFCEDGKNENASLRHFDDGTQVHLRFGTGGSILVADQPNRNPESIDFFSYLDHFLLFDLKHFERILHFV